MKFFRVTLIYIGKKVAGSIPCLSCSSSSPPGRCQKRKGQILGEGRCVGARRREGGWKFATISRKIWEGHWKIEAIRSTRGVCPGINNSGGGLLARERATSCEARGGRGIRVSEVKRALVHRSKNVGRPSLFAADPSWWNNDESFLPGKFLPPWTKVNEETLSLTSSDCLFFLDPILFSWVFFVRLGERGRLFFPNDVFKKNDGKRSSRGDLSSDFYSSGGRCCRVIRGICVTRWKFNFKLTFSDLTVQIRCGKGEN